MSRTNRLSDSLRERGTLRQLLDCGAAAPLFGGRARSIQSSRSAGGSESGVKPPHSKSWRYFFATLCLFVALFAQLSPLDAQPAAPNYVLSLGGTNGFLELPSRDAQQRVPTR